MIFDTKAIILLLPLEEILKKDLLAKYDKLPDAERGEVSRLIWDTYTALFEIKLEENLLAAINNPEVPLSEELYEKVKHLTDEQMQTEESTVTEKLDLTETREALSNIINPTKKLPN